MRDFQKKQKLKNLFYSPISLVVLALLTFLLVKGAVGILGKERESARTLSALESGNQKLEERQTELKEEIDKLQTPEGVMQEIRAKFNATREGEHLAVIVDDSARATTTATTTWRKFLNFWHFW